MQKLIKELILKIGEDPEREGLKGTPKRFERAFEFLTSGYSMSLDDIVGNAIFSDKYDEMVIVKDIDFYSLCEHHLLPFFGKCHVAYIPKGKLIGLSKIPRIVDMFSRRLQIQERITTQIAESLMQILHPHGVGVVLEGYHLCTMMRGIQKQNAYMVTSAMLGNFRSDPRTRNEFLHNVQRKIKL